MSRVVWITGAHGFIGRHAALAVAQQGATVLGVGHGHWPPTEAERWLVSHWINGDINQSNLHALCATSGRPDTVIHLAGGSTVGAAIAHPREDFFRTVATTVELLEWLRVESPETALVAISSAAVYGAGYNSPIPESAKLNPYSPYGYHKQMMESLCKSYASSFGLRTVVARLFSVYGGGLQKQLLWDICSRLEKKPINLELGGTGEELRDWIDVSDVANAIANLSVHASETVPIINIGSGVGTSVRKIAELLTGYWSGNGDDVPKVRFSGRSRPGDPFSLVADTSQMNNLKLQCSRSVAEGIAAYVDWFRSHQKI